MNRKEAHIKTLNKAAVMVGLAISQMAFGQVRVVVPVDPTGTWLYRDSCDSDSPPTSLDLPAIGISPGDQITVEKKGKFIFKSGGLTSRRMIAVFTAADGTLLKADRSVKVKKVITDDTYCSGTPTDIPEDFELKSSTPVVVPTNARFILFSPPDSLFRDNHSENYRAIVSK